MKILLLISVSNLELKEFFRSNILSNNYLLKDSDLEIKSFADDNELKSLALGFQDYLNENDDNRIMIVSDYGLETIFINSLDDLMCSNITDEYTAIYTRLHNNLRITTFPSKILAKEFIAELIKISLNTNFENDPRHNKRLQQIRS